MSKRILFLILILTTILSASIDDGDAMSGPLVDAIDGLSVAQDVVSAAKTAQAASGAGEAWKLWKADPRKQLIENFQTVVSPAVDSKRSIIATVEKGLKKTNEVIGRVSKRVDMWRNTKPTIERYYKRALRLMDSTKELAQEFTWEKFFDPKRKWDRKRELLFDANKDGTKWRGAYVQYYKDVSAYMKDLYGMSDTARGKELAATRAVVMPNFGPRDVPNLANIAGELDSAKIPGYENVMVPYKALDYSALLLFVLKEVESQYTRPKQIDGSGPEYSHSTATIAEIANKLGNSRQTYVDTRELGTYIALERAKVREQSARASQLQTQANTYHANLITRERENREIAAMQYERSVQVLSMGRTAAERYWLNVDNSVHGGGY